MNAQPILFPVSAPSLDVDLGMRDLLRLLIKHWAVIVVCTVLAALLGYGIYAVQKPVYSSVARVWVKTEQGSPSFLSGVTAYREALYPDPVNRRIETEMELMLTRTSAAAVVKKLQVRDEQLPGDLLPQVVAGARRLLGLPPSTAARLAAAPADGAVPNSLVDGFLKAVNVEPLRSKTADTTSNILEVHFDSSDTTLAPRALSMLLENYLGVAATQNRRLGEEAARLLAAELDQAREELLGLDQQIVALAARGSAATAASAESNTGDGSSKRGKSRSGGRRENTFSGAPVGNEQALAALKTQTVQMQAELDALRELYTDDADNVKALRRRLGAMQNRLAEGLTASVRAVSSQGMLERQRLLAQDRYNEVQKKLDQIKLYLRLNPADAESRVIVDAPSQPAANEGRKRSVIVLLGPIAGLLLGLLLAGLREFFDHRLQSGRDVRAQLGLPLLGALPRIGGRERERLAGSSSALS